ncbi:MAG: ChbG/HpnK family deacetylase [Thermoleophilia bacterium]|nr:ChbG/HpnK family deacetylase [Thermoleophilia bacterium]
MRRLIVNADDFGLTSGVNRAVVECYQRGVVTSATLMVNGRAAVEAALLAADNPGLGIGLHLNLTSGPPLMPPESVPSLVSGDGVFPGLKAALWRLTSGSARTHELEDEITAQIDRLIKLGIRPTHIDSHHHLHAHPRLRSLVRKICPRHGVNRMRGFNMSPRSPKAIAVAFAARMPSSGGRMSTPDRFSGMEVMGNRDMAAALRRSLAANGDILEFMCHPGYADDELVKSTSYNTPRQAELLKLLSTAFTAAIDEAGAARISYAAL